ncbi:hypothetical protein FGW71_19985 [Salmonella enterica]|nr:hypothetical protein [Salmonella enterica]
MPDNVDFIQEQQAELLERQINAARVKHCGVSSLVKEVTKNDARVRYVCFYAPDAATPDHAA